MRALPQECTQSTNALVNLLCLLCLFAAQTRKSGPGPPASPARRCTNLPSFPGYLIYIFNSLPSPEKFKKKILEHALSVFQNQNPSFVKLYIVMAARTLLRAIGLPGSVAGDRLEPIMYISVSHTSREPVPTTWPFSSSST
jgi:hypothetical protein